jgi:anti-sigma factor RsiW
MSHPTELLAAYVDGTLAERERLAVEAHLETCAPCRGEIELARAVVPALRALPDEPVPVGVTRPVLERAGRRGWSSDPRTARSRSRRPNGSWVLGGTVAASIVLLVAVVLNQGGGGGGITAAGGGTAEVASPASGAEHKAAARVPLERQDRNYDQTAARTLGQQAESAPFDQATLSGGQSVTPGASPTPVPAAPAISNDAALACLRNAGATFSDSERLVRLILARYLGQPAYLGVFLEGPPDKRPETVAVWVVGTNDCQPRLLTSERI